MLANIVMSSFIQTLNINSSYMLNKKILKFQKKSSNIKYILYTNVIEQCLSKYGDITNKETKLTLSYCTSGVDYI